MENGGERRQEYPQDALKKATLCGTASLRMEKVPCTGIIKGPSEQFPVPSVNDSSVFDVPRNTWCSYLRVIGI